MRLSIAFARSTFIAIPNERQVKSLIDDLVTKRGVVSGRLALLRGSTETQPLLLDLKNKSPPPRKRSRVVPPPASARVRLTPPRPPDSHRVRPTPPRPQRRGNAHGSPPGPRSSSSARAPPRLEVVDLLRGSTETQPLETLTGHFPGNAHGSSRRKIFLTTPRVRVPRPRGRRLRQNLPFSRLRRAGLSASLRGCGGCRRARGVWGLSASLGGGAGKMARNAHGSVFRC